MMLAPSSHPPSFTRTWGKMLPIRGWYTSPEQCQEWSMCKIEELLLFNWYALIVMEVILKSPSSISVTVSVLSIEGTDCRLDELGRLADRTRGNVSGNVKLCFLWFVWTVNDFSNEYQSSDRVVCSLLKVVIASPSRLHTEFEQIIENRTIATHCTVTLLLPKSL